MSRQFRGEAVQSWTMPSSTNPETRYTVKLWPAGDFSCDCPRWRFKRGGSERNCPHIVAIQAVQAQLPPPTCSAKPKPNEPTAERRFRLVAD